MLVNSLIFLLSFNWQEVGREVQAIPLVPTYYDSFYMSTVKLVES